MSWLRRVIEKMERAAMASAYAQAGETELAREILKEGDEEEGSER